MSQIRRLSLIFIFSLTLLFFPSTLLAQTPYPEARSDTYDAGDHAGFTFGQLMKCGISYNIGTVIPGTCTFEDSEGKIYETAFHPNSAMAQMTTVMTAMYNKPTSTTHYLADLGSRWGLISPAYAQTESVPGSGSTILSPIYKLWEASRDISYLGFVVVFIVVGFMIMLRTRINPQTVITAQAAIPGLIIGLILVTFSYLIASLLIDIAFLGVQLVAQIFSQRADNLFGQNLQQIARDSNAFQLFMSTTRRLGDPEISSGINQTLNSVNFQGVPGQALTAAAGGVIGLLVGMLMFALGPLGLVSGALGLGAGTLAGATAPTVISWVVPVILLIALLVQFFRLLFGLITSYVQLLIATVAGPFAILLSAIPGRGPVVSLWWKTILANALIFPTVLAAFFFAGMILATDPNVWQASPPLFGGLSLTLLRLLIAYGIILGTPAIPDMVRQALGVRAPASYIQAAFQGASGGADVAGEGTGRLFRPITQARQAYRENVYRTRFAPGNPAMAGRPWITWGQPR